MRGENNRDESVSVCHRNLIFSKMNTILLEKSGKGSGRFGKGRISELVSRVG